MGTELLTGELVTSRDPAGQLHKGGHRLLTLMPQTKKINSHCIISPSCPNLRPRQHSVLIVEVLPSVCAGGIIVPCNNTWPASQESSGRCVPCTPLPCKQTKAAPTTPTLTIHSDIGLLPSFLLLLHLTSFLSFLKDPVKKKFTF